MCIRNVLVLLVVFVCLGGAGAALGETVFSDGVFSGSDWSWQEFVQQYGEVDEVSTQPTGGNPDEFRVVDFWFEGAPDDIIYVFQYFLEEYVPSVEGPISSLSLSMDFLSFDGNPTEIGWLIYQNGEYFIYQHETSAGDPIWDPKQSIVTDVNQFVHFQNPYAHPDFSDTGAPIMFGFYTGQTFEMLSQPSSFVHGVDNWQVTVNANDIWFHDADDDGYGDPYEWMQSVSQPQDHVALAGDCNDNEGNIHPGALEICDSIDNDCDGLIDGDDPDNVDSEWWFLDADGDSYGDPATGIYDCLQPAPGYVVVEGTDCDDSDIDSYPGAPELCDGKDNNCDGTIDEGFALLIFYPDDDGDSYGATGHPGVEACSSPPGSWVENDFDCDDLDSEVNPDSDEICDGKDNNCDGQVNEGLGETFIYYEDLDGDYFGAIDGNSQYFCDVPPPPGWADNELDCDDTNENVNPDAEEICGDGLDNDCNGIPDDGCAQTVMWYHDQDGDGWGEEEAGYYVDPPFQGAVTVGGDCNDGDENINPGAPEVCNGIDDDCDSISDEGEPGTLGIILWFEDKDNDGWGDPATGIYSCDQPSPSHAEVEGEDCDDLDFEVYPGAPELCDGKDNDCNGIPDDGCAQTVMWYHDQDGDGWGDEEAGYFVDPPFPGAVTVNGDCDDWNLDVYPEAIEICDGIDNNCDGEADEGACLQDLLSFRMWDFLPAGCNSPATVILQYGHQQGSQPLRGYNITIGQDSEFTYGAGDISFTSVMSDLAAADPLVNLMSNVQDNGDGTITVMQTLLGPTEGITSDVDLFMITVTGLEDGSGILPVLAYDLRTLDNAPISGGVADGVVPVDCVGPNPVTGLTARPGYHKVNLFWDNPEQQVSHAIFRGIWHDGGNESAYPEYDDLPGSTIPLLPASYAAAVASPEWDLVGSTLVGDQMSFEDVIGPPRGVYYYVVIAYDRVGNEGQPSTDTARATNYWLGDFSADDGFVEVPDLTVFGSQYGYGELDPGYDNELDIGPTGNYSRTGIPTTDNLINFEDLMVIAMNFNIVSPLASPAGGSGLVMLGWEQEDAQTWSLKLREPAAGLKGLTLTAPVTGGGTLQVNQGEVVRGSSTPVFFRNIDRNGLDLGIAALGRGTRLNGVGEICQVVFTGGGRPGPIAIEARGTDNKALEITFDMIELPVAPAVALGSYPNPFNPMATIWFEIPEAAEVQLRIYDVAGRLVRTLADRAPFAQGRNEVVWNGTSDTGGRVSSGSYFCRLESRLGSMTHRMVLLK